MYQALGGKGSLRDSNEMHGVLTKTEQQTLPLVGHSLCPGAYLRLPYSRSVLRCV